MTEQIAKKPYNLKEEFSLKKLLGKHVLSHSGEILGKVTDIYIKDYSIIGITVSKNPDLFIEKTYFESFRENAVVLKIDPIPRIVGLPVLDCNGRKIGKVNRIERPDTTNTFTAIFVKKNLLSKEIRFEASEVQTISQNIILKIEIE
ncbi:MAG: PRC-barrel domain-containing protein [Candidatus Woesearchaeota archaeon]